MRVRPYEGRVCDATAGHHPEKIPNSTKHIFGPKTLQDHASSYASWKGVFVPLGSYSASISNTKLEQLAPSVPSVDGLFALGFFSSPCLLLVLFLWAVHYAICLSREIYDYSVLCFQMARVIRAEVPLLESYNIDQAYLEMESDTKADGPLCITYSIPGYHVVKCRLGYDY